MELPFRFDVDFFKLYNDRYGHQAGDNCLIRVAQAAKNVVKRKADLVARYGGEEFAIVLPNTDRKGAVNVAQSIQEKLHQLQILHEESQVNRFVTISIGISSQIPKVRMDNKETICRADSALYAAKRQGRDRYCIYDESREIDEIKKKQCKPIKNNSNENAR